MYTPRTREDAAAVTREKSRDRWCYHDYCDTPATRCQIDHIEPFSAGGLTAQDNGRSACGAHNRHRHRRPPPDPDW